MFFTPTFVQWLVKVASVSGLLSISGSAGFFSYRYANDKSFRDKGKAMETQIKKEWSDETKKINEAVNKAKETSNSKSEK